MVFLMGFAVTIVSPPNYPHTEATREVAESLYYALVSLGHDTILTTRTDILGRRPIVLCPHLLPHVHTPLAADAVLYNLEQVESVADKFSPRLLDLFRRHEVWDYSTRNIEQWARMDIRAVRHLPVGYVPQLSRIPRDEADIDVQFYGRARRVPPTAAKQNRRRCWRSPTRTDTRRVSTQFCQPTSDPGRAIRR